MGDDEAELIARLRAGDEAAFMTLVDRYHAPLLRLAQSFVPNRAVAEEVVQDTWIGVLRGIDRFESRSSLKTWLFRILVNRARTAGVRERRHTPVDVGALPAVPPERFDAGGGWADPPVPWTDDVDERLDAAKVAELIAGHLDRLPDTQRQVLLLRDSEGLPSPEVCELLGLTEANQRVLLHRARSKVRGFLEAEMGKV